jgi:hypothetical protein
VLARRVGMLPRHRVVYPNGGLSPRKALAYAADGFAVGMHVNTGCNNVLPMDFARIFGRDLPFGPGILACRRRGESGRIASRGATGYRRQSASTSATTIGPDRGHRTVPAPGGVTSCERERHALPISHRDTALTGRWGHKVIITRRDALPRRSGAVPKVGVARGFRDASATCPSDASIPDIRLIYAS